MDWLTVAINGALFLACVWAWLNAGELVKRAERRRRQFDDGITRIAELKVTMAALQAQQEQTGDAVHKLRGLVYRQRQLTTPKPPEEPETADQVRARLRAANGLPRVGPRQHAADDTE